MKFHNICCGEKNILLSPNVASGALTEKKLEEAIITYRYYGCVNISKNFYDDFNKLAVDR